MEDILEDSNGSAAAAATGGGGAGLNFIKNADSPRRSSRSLSNGKPNYLMTEVFDDIHYGKETLSSSSPMLMKTRTTPTTPTPIPSTTTITIPILKDTNENVLRKKKIALPTILPANSINNRTIRLTVNSQPQEKVYQKLKKKSSSFSSSSSDIIPPILCSSSLDKDKELEAKKTRKRKEKMEKMEKKIRANIKPKIEATIKNDDDHDDSLKDGRKVEKEIVNEGKDVEISSSLLEPKRRRKKKLSSEWEEGGGGGVEIKHQEQQQEHQKSFVREKRIVYEGNCQHCLCGTMLTEDTPSKEQRNPLISCDICSLLFHIDCLPNPMICAPSPGVPFTCPLHLDYSNLKEIFLDDDVKISNIQDSLWTSGGGGSGGGSGYPKIGIESWPGENLFIWPESSIKCQMSWRVRGNHGEGDRYGDGYNNGLNDDDDIMDADENEKIKKKTKITFFPPSSISEHYKYIRALRKSDVQRLKYLNTLKYRNQGCETEI